MNTDPRVLNLVLRWQELQREGHPIPIAQLCADCPELAAAVARQLEALTSVDALLTVTDAIPTQPLSSAPATEPTPDTSPAEYAGRFRLLVEIARGGMGAVLRAHDTAIGRDVAIKIILPKYSQIPAIVRRFFAEARLAGQLQHPGVAPVYDLGQLPDGQPFFAMKLIEGRTLSELLREQKDTGATPGLPPACLPRFLKYFEAVCQTVGYAHTRNVVHRDLKPANVMIGAFGEVQVMDWGLAKVLRGTLEEPDDALDFQDPPAGAEAETVASAVIGTPGYMAPEQVIRDWGRIDERSDVFGLGAMLCEILTGSPPFHGRDPHHLLWLTARGELAEAFARLECCGADGELVRLAKACLEPEKEKRPRNGGMVAAGMTAYLLGVQERLRQLEMARARAEEERQRRRVQLAQAHYSLGDTLNRQGRFKEAEAAYREAIVLKPDAPLTHINLGVTLTAQGRFQEAEAAFREALRLHPASAMAHINLGNALYRQGRPREAEAAYHEALRLEPDNHVAHCNLGAALQELGRFLEAVELFRRGQALGSKVPGWQESSAQWVRAAERLVELDQRLPAVLSGTTEPPKAAELLELAALCQHPARRLHAAAVRLAADAFAVEPPLADDLNTQPRYNAACSAALAAAGQAEDTRDLPEEVASGLRKQALAWLRADLDLYATLAGHDDPAAKENVRQQLTHWLTDLDLASVRDRNALARLPEADAWHQLWAEVDTLRQRVSGR